jgi:hypothetical protein
LGLGVRQKGLYSNPEALDVVVKALMLEKKGRALNLPSHFLEHLWLSIEHP